MNKLFENERTFRQTNKTISDKIHAIVPFEDADDPLQLNLYCECVNIECLQRFKSSSNEYEVVHEQPLRFMVKPSHYLPQFERVIKKTPEYWVVEKIEEELDTPFSI